VTDAVLEKDRVYHGWAPGLDLLGVHLSTVKVRMVGGRGMTDRGLRTVKARRVGVRDDRPMDGRRGVK